MQTGMYGKCCTYRLLSHLDRRALKFQPFTSSLYRSAFNGAVTTPYIGRSLLFISGSKVCASRDHLDAFRRAREEYRVPTDNEGEDASRRRHTDVESWCRRSLDMGGIRNAKIFQKGKQQDAQLRLLVRGSSILIYILRQGYI